MTMAEQPRVRDRKTMSEATMSKADVIEDELRRFDLSIKRFAFTVAVFYGAFHLFGVAVLAFAGDASPLAAALFLDGVGLLYAFSSRVAKRLFPDKPEN